MLEKFLSKQAGQVLSVVSVLTIVALVYFHFLNRGPMYWVASWTADSEGRYYFSIALLGAFVPLFFLEWLVIYAADQLFLRSLLESDHGSGTPGSSE